MIVLRMARKYERDPRAGLRAVKIRLPARKPREHFTHRREAAAVESPNTRH
jgi:hypothetical protein